MLAQAEPSGLIFPPTSVDDLRRMERLTTRATVPEMAAESAGSERR